MVEQEKKFSENELVGLALNVLTDFIVRHKAKQAQWVNDLAVVTIKRHGEVVDGPADKAVSLYDNKFNIAIKALEEIALMSSRIEAENGEYIAVAVKALEEIKKGD